MLRPSYLFALGGLILVAIAETGRIPVDNPATHLELTMIHEAMLLEYSGRHLALMEWAAQIKLLLYGALIANIFFPWGIGRSFAPAALGIGLAAVSGQARSRSAWRWRSARRCWPRCGCSAPRPFSTSPCCCRCSGC